MDRTKNLKDLIVQAQSLIAEIYKLRNEKSSYSAQQLQIHLCKEDLLLLRKYRFLMGEAKEKQSDYLGEDSIFGMDLLIHDKERPEIVVIED